MTCKDCFHERVCFALIKKGLPYADGKFPAEAFCMAFRNKAEFAEVNHGHWIYKKTYYEADECNCSLCGQLMTTGKGKRMNYCPNCGAKMDEKKEGKK